MNSEIHYSHSSSADSLLNKEFLNIQRSAISQRIAELDQSTRTFSIQSSSATIGIHILCSPSLLRVMTDGTNHRGTGYGRMTIQALRGLKELDVDRARLRVYAENQPAIGLYESLGFKVEKKTIDLILWFD
jgi:RimJ/RimL family protein N-acetyltransferase